MPIVLSWSGTCWGRIACHGMEFDMTEDRDFKRLVRARMAETGEQYTQAREALRPSRPGPGPEQSESAQTPQTDLGATGRVSSLSIGAYLAVEPGLSSDELVLLAAVGIPVDRFADLRSALPAESVNQLVDAYLVDVTPEVATAWRQIDPAITVDQMMGSVTMGLTPNRFEEFRRSRPEASVEDVWQWETMGLTP